MTGAFWKSAIVAALFAVHPLHVESVAWVSERKDVLSAVFFFLMLDAYVRYARAIVDNALSRGDRAVRGRTYVQAHAGNRPDRPSPFGLLAAPSF